MADVEFNRKFQEEDVPFFLTHPKSMILYEPRLGKTPVACRMIAQDPKTRNVLINCSKNALSVWLDHLIPWWNYYRGEHTPLYVRFIRGTPAERKALWDRPHPDGALVYLQTFEGYMEDTKTGIAQKPTGYFDTIILDEVHRKLRSRNNKSVTLYKPLVRQARRAHFLSGTMTSKWGPADFWTILNLISPSQFSSYWRFVDQYCITIDGAWGGKQIVGVRNREAFHFELSRFARVRLREFVAAQMPKVQRDILWVEPTKEQYKHIQELGKTSYTFTSGGVVVVAENSLERHTRKRQLLVCPKILDPSLGIGAAFADLVERLEEARDDEDEAGTHVVIFTALRAAIPHFETYLRDHGFTNIGILVGSTEPEDVVRITKQFRDTKGIILGTTQFAQAFSLVPSTVCYHVGADYDPGNNKQAEDRLVPQVGVNPINSWYYGVRGTDDDDLVANLMYKQELINYTQIDPRQNLYRPTIDLSNFITSQYQPPEQNTSDIS